MSRSSALSETAVDVARARRETPGCALVTHLNNAGAALPPTVVTDTSVTHLRREAEIGGYEAAAEAAERVENVYRSLARLVGCAPDEIAVVEARHAAGRRDAEDVRARVGLVELDHVHLERRAAVREREVGAERPGRQVRCTDVEDHGVDAT